MLALESCAIGFRISLRPLFDALQSSAAAIPWYFPREPYNILWMRHAGAEVSMDLSQSRCPPMACIAALSPRIIFKKKERVCWTDRDELSICMCEHKNELAIGINNRYGCCYFKKRKISHREKAPPASALVFLLRSFIASPICRGCDGAEGFETWVVVVEDVVEDCDTKSARGEM
ncbi:hypothetical protein BU16DRAFT_339223 [Lophium mytilinum]|uniref:Uncharacterized protein n=1 Tax=Lophium mytilinum TaxID=390894 RepID=A0A6A6QW30_9PEZI|nr:hypothetical protein BU16DRAFT_339223 [Lophium mytilinum]